VAPDQGRDTAATGAAGGIGWAGGIVMTPCPGIGTGSPAGTTHDATGPATGPAVRVPLLPSRFDWKYRFIRQNMQLHWPTACERSASRWTVTRYIPSSSGRPTPGTVLAPGTGPAVVTGVGDQLALLFGVGTDTGLATDSGAVGRGAGATTAGTSTTSGECRAAGALGATGVLGDTMTVGGGSGLGAGSGLAVTDGGAAAATGWSAGVATGIAAGPGGMAGSAGITGSGTLAAGSTWTAWVTPGAATGIAGGGGYGCAIAPAACALAGEPSRTYPQAATTATATRVTPTPAANDRWPGEREGGRIPPP
jgi:hypothetical protein